MQKVNYNNTSESIELDPDEKLLSRERLEEIFIFMKYNKEWFDKHILGIVFEQAGLCFDILNDTNVDFKGEFK